MPTDDLELEGSQQAPPGDDSNSPAEPTPAAPSAAPTLSPEQISDMMSQAARAGNQPILEALQNLQQTMAEQAQANQPPQGSDDFVEEFLTKGKPALAAAMDEWAKTNLAKPMMRDFEIQRDERIETRATEIDEDWGDGWFDANIRPRLVGDNGVLSHWPINQQSDPIVIDNAINGIMGNDYRDPEKRAAMAEALQKTTKSRQERQVRDAPHMMGPGRPYRRSGETISPAMKHTIESAQNAGVPLTEQAIKETLRRGNTLSDWTKPAEARQ